MSARTSAARDGAMKTDLERADDPSTAEGLRILLVDDDADILDSVSSAIAELGHEVVATRDAAEGLGVYRSGTFDVVVSDWMMPGMSGLDLCREVRAHPSERYAYFIFLTALGDRTHALEGMRAGADDYLTKPLDLDELEVRLLAATRVQALHHRLVRQNTELRRDSARLIRAVHLDPLTGLGNRRALDAHLASLAETSSHTCIALLDIDHFKALNDAQGHPAGDVALRRVATTVRDHLRRGDCVFRYGGEEFLVVLHDQTLDQARSAVERVRTAVERAAIPAPSGVVTLSAGVAERGSAALHVWVAAADAALYHAKSEGRNRVEVAREGHS